MVSPQINIAGLHKVADFRFNQHHRVATVINKIPHQLEFFVYQGKFSLYVPPEHLETAKVLSEKILTAN